MLNFRKFSFILILFILSAIHVSAQTVVNGGYTFQGPLTSNDLDSGNVANKNFSTDGVQYVSPSGNDSNDGLSWGTAKLTWVGACQALPNGNTSPPTCGRGTIYYAHGSSANPVSGAGIWLFGTSNDPGYAGGVTGWNRTTGPIQTICAGSDSQVVNNGSVTCIMNGGNASDNNHPLLWLSALNNGFEFDGLQANFQGQPIKLSVCSDGTNNGTCAVQNVVFDRFQVTMGNLTAGLGPAVLVGDGSFWIIFRNYNISGNANNSPTADNGAAVLLTRNTTQSGLIEFTDGGTNTGGIKYYPGTGAYLLVNGLTTTENNLEALLWVAGGADNTESTISIQNAGVSDCNTGVAHCAVVRNDGVGPIHTSNISGTTIGQVAADIPTLKNFLPDSPKNVVGWLSYGTAFSSSGFGLLPSIRAQAGNIPRSFPPSIAFGTNLVSVGTTSACGTCTITTGVLDPTGQSNAIRISDSANVQDASHFTLSSSGGAVNGDTYVVSMWIRSTNGTGYSRGDAFGFYLNETDICNGSVGQVAPNQMTTTENAWKQYIAVCKITTGPSGTPDLQLFNQLGFTTEYAYPQVVLFHGYNDEDLSNIAMNMGTWAANCPVGDTCPITMFGFPGSTAFEGLVTHANTANRTYTFPNVTGNIPAYTVSQTNLDCVDWSGTAGLLGDPGGACARYTISPTNGDCVTWSGTGGLLGDAGAACGASGGGLNTNMNNMANPTAMSQSLIPGAVNSIALGSQALPFTNGFFGTVANQSGSFNTANLTANRVINWPDATSTTVRACASVSNQFLTAIAVATGVCSQAQPTLANIAAGASPSGLFDFSGSTMKVPQANGFTASAISTIGLDTAAGAFHFWIGAADSINAAFASAPAGSKCIQSSGVIGLLTEASAACGTTTPSSVDTFTHKTEDVEGTGNSFSEPVRAFFPAGGCNNSTAGNGWDIGVTNVPLPQCAGTTVRKGVLQFARGNTGYINWHLPSDWNSSVSTDIEICFTTTDTTNGHVTSFNIQTGFNAVNGTVTDDPTLNTLQALSVTTGASQTSGGQLCGKLTSMTMTGSAADYNFEIAVTRNNSGTDTNTDTGVLVKSAEIITGVTKNAANR